MQITVPPWLRGWRILLILFIGLMLVIAALWLLRVRLATEVAASYFRSQGVTSSIEISALGFSGAAGRFALGPGEAPELAADSLEIDFDPLRWMPHIVEVRLVNPLLRAKADAQGRISLPSLQRWLDSMSQSQEKSPYVSDDLIVSLTNLRALIASPNGNLDLRGDLRLEKGVPVSAAIGLQPTRLEYQGTVIAVAESRVDFTTNENGIQGTAKFSGHVQGPQTRLTGVRTSIAVNGLKWKMEGKVLALAAPSLRLQLAAEAIDGATQVRTPVINVTAENASVLFSGAELDGAAELSVTANAKFNAEPIRRMLALDPALGAALAANLASPSLEAKFRVERRAKQVRVFTTAPATIKGDKGGIFTIAKLSLEGPENALSGAFESKLAGGGLPAATLDTRNIKWTNGALEADTSLSSRFDFAMLRGADMSTDGKLSWRGDTLTFNPSSCARVTLVSFRPGGSTMAENLRGQICASDRPMLTANSQGWNFSADARGASGFLPLATSQAENVSARLSFEGKTGANLTGRVAILNGQISDRMAPARFKPMLGSGTVTLKDWVWGGQFALTTTAKHTLGTVSFTHVMATSTGSAHIAAGDLTFAPEKFQPEDITPLLAALRRAEGSARFDGDIGWSPGGFTSRGTLAINALDFMTPLGKAHAVNSTIDFTSLLPPVTAPNQNLTISHVDWTLPFTNVGVRFSIVPTAIEVAALETGIAEGRVAISAFTINLADPGRVAGTAEISSISLASLITASNLSNRVKMEGKVTGRIPFTITPEGFRVVNGRVAADGPGRLSIDRVLWTQGATTTNSVQDFAYQALENLAFDEMSAEINSVANGRLQIVFRIKGRSDPPTRQVADIPVTDIVNGSALQNPVPLPSGTPIDLTLDTSLNFDELLKSYKEAWSNTLSP